MNLAFEDTFSVPGKPSSSWVVYNGIGGPGTSYTHWSRANAVVGAGGLLNLFAQKDSTGQWTAGGMSLARTLNFTYGQVRVKFRCDKADGIKYCLLLWPQNGWPPEIDFAEDSPIDGSRTRTSGTLHYGSNNLMIHEHVSGDFTKMHEMGINWTPGTLEYVLDGVVWASVSNAVVPSQPMHLAIQNSVHSPTSATPAKSKLQVDYVRIYT